MKMSPEKAFKLKAQPTEIEQGAKFGTPNQEGDSASGQVRGEVAKVIHLQEDPGEIKETKQGGRINKNLIYGAIAAVAMGFLVFNFFPQGEGRSSGESTSSINERIPNFAGNIRRSTPAQPTPEQTEQVQIADVQYPPRSGQPATPDINEDTLFTTEPEDPPELDPPPTLAAAPTPPPQPVVQQREPAPQVIVIEQRYSQSQAESPIGVSANSQNFPDGVGQSALPTGGILTGSGSVNNTPSVYELFEQANAQRQKESFAQTSPPQIETVVDEYSIAPGTIIRAVLVTGLNTDLPGYIIARVTSHIFDHPTGNNILIPAGSDLIARYNSVITYGQTRIQIAWQTLVRPDGVTVNLGNSPGIDREGFAGNEADFVDGHIFQIGGGIVLSSMITILNGVSENLISSLLEQGALSESISQALADTSQITNDAVRRWLDVQPTLTLNAGSVVNILVTERISLPPAEVRLSNDPYIRR